MLQAAHFRPVSEGGAHRVDNGLLLRSDVHTLFDRGYLTVTPAFKLRLSRRLRDDFDNGEHYYQYEKSDLWVPGQAEDGTRTPCFGASSRGTPWHLRAFPSRRDWAQFHDPQNLAMAVVSEAGEWAAEYRARGFFDRIGVDFLEAVGAKIELNRRNYPVEGVRNLGAGLCLRQPAGARYSDDSCVKPTAGRIAAPCMLGSRPGHRFSSQTVTYRFQPKTDIVS